MFTPRILGLVRSLTEAAWKIPNSTRVDGITNFQHTWANGDELIVEDLVGTGEITAAVADRARDVALTEPLLAKRLVSEDAGATGVNVRVSLPGESGDELPATVEHVRMLLDQYRAEYPDVEIHAAGITMLNSAFAEAPMRDLPVVMPLMFGALLLAIVLFLRTFSGIVGTLAVVGCSTVTALGVAGHLVGEQVGAVRGERVRVRGSRLPGSRQVLLSFRARGDVRRHGMLRRRAYPAVRALRLHEADRLVGQRRVPRPADRLLRPQGLAPQDACLPRVPAVPRAVLASRPHDDGESPEREVDGPGVRGVDVRRSARRDHITVCRTRARVHLGESRGLDPVPRQAVSSLGRARRRPDAFRPARGERAVPGERLDSFRRRGQSLLGEDRGAPPGRHHQPDGRRGGKVGL